MKRKTMLIVTATLIMVLSVSSVIAISQAWWKPKPEYVGFDLKVIYGPVTVTYVDASGAPELVIVEHIIETAVECTVTIDDKVYSYSDDFDISVTHHAPWNRWWSYTNMSHSLWCQNTHGKR